MAKEITPAVTASLFTGFKAAFQRGFVGVASAYQKVATVVPSTTDAEDYGWLGDLPDLREWVGERLVNEIKGDTYSVKNRPFEGTVGVPKTTIEDDKEGVYAPLFETLGQSAARFPDKLVFGGLADGFHKPCYDKQNFFDTDHPVLVGGVETSVSNILPGSGKPWFLLDTSRPLKPMIFQERKKANLVKLDKETDSNVFFDGKLIYGVDMRCNAGYGFWQMATASKAPLDAAAFKEMRRMMRAFESDNGNILGIEPTILVVGTGNADIAEELIDMDFIDNGRRNPLYKKIEVLHCKWLK